MFSSGPAETSVVGGVRESGGSEKGGSQNGDRLGLGLDQSRRLLPLNNGETERIAGKGRHARKTWMEGETTLRVNAAGLLQARGASGWAGALS